MSTLQAVVALVVALLAGGGVVGLLTWRATRRRINADALRMEADAHRTEAEAGVAVQTRYDALFDDLQTEVKRLREDQSHDRIEVRKAKDDMLRAEREHQECIKDLGDRRAEVLRLQDRLDKLEEANGSVKTEAVEAAREAARSTVSEFIEQLGGQDR